MRFFTSTFVVWALCVLSAYAIASSGPVFHLPVTHAVLDGTGGTNMNSATLDAAALGTAGTQARVKCDWQQLSGSGGELALSSSADDGSTWHEIESQSVSGAVGTWVYDFKLTESNVFKVAWDHGSTTAGGHVECVIVGRG